MEMLEFIQSKILVDQIDIDRQIAVMKFKNQKIVFTNGCFDIIHKGHVEYLSKASEFGDVLVIGLNSDRSVNAIKGENRPINDETARAMVLASMTFVEAIMLFDEETPYELIKRVEPDVLVKGADYKEDEIVGADILKGYGGDIVTIELVEGYSTSGMIDRIKSI